MSSLRYLEKRVETRNPSGRDWSNNCLCSKPGRLKAVQAKVKSVVRMDGLGKGKSYLIEKPSFEIQQADLSIPAGRKQPERVEIIKGQTSHWGRVNIIGPDPVRIILLAPHFPEIWRNFGGSQSSWQVFYIFIHLLTDPVLSPEARRRWLELGCQARDTILLNDIRAQSWLFTLNVFISWRKSICKSPQDAPFSPLASSIRK